MSSSDFRIRIHTGPIPLKRVPNADVRNLILPAKCIRQAGKIVWKFLSVRIEGDELVVIRAQPAVIHEDKSNRDVFIFERSDTVKDLFLRNVVSVGIPRAPAERLENLGISFLPP